MNFSALKASEAVRHACSIGREQGVAVFLVGGAVRDLMRGIPEPRDCDFVIDGDVGAFAERFAQAVNGAVIPWDRDQIRLVYTSRGCRVCCDFSRLRGGDIGQDLRLRDFTVNACAIALVELAENDNPTIIDPCNGARDLREGRLVCCGPTCFSDDPVRMLRALRIARECGLTLDATVVDGMVRAAGLITKPARERIKREFFMVLGCSDAYGSLKLLADTGILDHILPEAAAFRGVIQSSPHRYDLFRHQMETVRHLDELIAEEFCSFEPYDANLRSFCGAQIEEGVNRRSLLILAGLLHDSGKSRTGKKAQGRITFHGHEREGEMINRAIARRIGLGKTAQRIVCGLTRSHMRILQLSLQKTVTQRAKIRLVRDCEDIFWELLPLAIADRSAAGDEDNEAAAALQRLAVELAQLRCESSYSAQRSPLLTGDDVRRVLAISESPEVGRILKELHEREERGLCDTREEALQWLTEIKPQHSK